jgi:hypothetical protein
MKAKLKDDKRSTCTAQHTRPDHNGDSIMNINQIDTTDDVSTIDSVITGVAGRTQGNSHLMPPPVCPDEEYTYIIETANNAALANAGHNIHEDVINQNQRVVPEPQPNAIGMGRRGRIPTVHGYENIQSDHQPIRDYQTLGDYDRNVAAYITI